MSSPSDNEALGKHRLYRRDPISSHHAFQYPTFPSLQKTRKILEARPQHHGLNAYLSLHPSSKEHEATTTLPAICQCGGYHMVNGQVRDISLGSQYGVSGRFEYFGHGRFLRNMGGRQVESLPSRE